MIDLNDKRDKPIKEVEEDRRQVAEWLKHNTITVVKRDGWYKQGVLIKKARTSEEDEELFRQQNPFKWR